ncbi:MAG TPA: A24 family peptidase [Polyangiaceae bacterium]|jgi:prepilin peptidase CpaA|nr:A24 family peptidase [Polyangiaceae bacterium]
MLVALVLAVVAAAWDLKTGEIPERLTLPAIALGVLLHAAFAFFGARGTVLVEAGFSVLGALVCALVPGILYLAKVGGGGDLTLSAALGALLQPRVGLDAIFYGFLAAALIAPAKLAYDGKLFAVLGNTVSLVTNPFRKREKKRELPTEMLTWFRMGPAFALGTALAVFLNWGSA